jgi:hypothetical protein
VSNGENVNSVRRIAAGDSSEASAQPNAVPGPTGTIKDGLLDATEGLALSDLISVVEPTAIPPTSADELRRHH